MPAQNGDFHVDIERNILPGSIPGQVASCRTLSGVLLNVVVLSLFVMYLGELQTRSLKLDFSNQGSCCATWPPTFQDLLPGPFGECSSNESSFYLEGEVPSPDPSNENLRMTPLLQKQRHAQLGIF